MNAESSFTNLGYSLDTSHGS